MGKTKLITKDFLDVLDNTSVNVDFRSKLSVASNIENSMTEKEIILSLKKENQELSETISSLKESLNQYENDSNLNMQVKEFSETSDKYKLLQEEHDKLKIRVKRDLRLIKERERELSNRIEILKQDNVALLHSKDGQILKLKKKVDDLQYELSVAQDKIQKSKRVSEEYENKLKQILRSLKISVSLIEAVKKDTE